MTLQPQSTDVPPELFVYTLGNGLTLVVQEMPWLPSASFNLLVPLGAATDPTGAFGSATVLNDWLYRGAGERNSRTLSDDLDALGVRRGGGAGGETSTFSASLLADALPEALAIYADIVQRPHLDEREFASARTVALQELASLDDNPAQRLFIALSKVYFASAQGRSAYGEADDLHALTPDALRDDATTRLAPNGAILAVAGGVRQDEVKALVETHFGAWQGQGVTLPEVRVAPVHTEHIAASTAQTQIGVAYSALPPGHDDWYHNGFVNAVLSRGMGSRLFAEVREKRGLVYSVMAVGRAVKNHGYTLAYAGTTPERAQETQDVLLGELRRIGGGVTEDELETARTGLLSNLVFEGESSGGVASSLVRDTYFLGAPRSLGAVKAALEAVTLEGVNRYLEARPDPDFTVLTLGPEPHLQLDAPTTEAIT